MKPGDLIKVSPLFRHLCLELEKCCAKVILSTTEEEMAVTWPPLAHSREELYRYIQDLETRVGVERSCSVRF